jgi:hypothetical protein
MNTFQNTSPLKNAKSKIESLAEGYQFIADNDKAYIQYKLDDKGRQYPVGSFNHFDTGVLVNVTNNAELAHEVIEDGGFSVKVAVKNAAKIIAGDPTAAAYFAKVELFQDDDTIATQATLNTNALQAALYLAANNA